MNEPTNKFSDQWLDIIDNFRSELKSLRSNRATPALVENLKVNYYGTPTALLQIATISTPEPRQILIEPWDKNVLKDIENIIQASENNFSVKNDGSCLRLNLPPLTEETRKSTVNILHKKAEEARVASRRIREDILKNAKKDKEAGNISEDDYFKLQKDVQEQIDDLNKQIKTITAEKELEIMTL